jgi:hypothetical protein
MSYFCSKCPTPHVCGANCNHSGNGKKKVLRVARSHGVSKTSRIPLPFKPHQSKVKIDIKVS